MSKRLELNSILSNPNHTPDDILKIFEADFKDIYDQPAGVWEGYSLRQHTLMVLGQFKKYFAAKELPAGVSQEFFKTLLALHDIGKPKAVQDGDKTKQHGYTVAILGKTLKELSFEPAEIALAAALVEGDPIGLYLKEKISMAESADFITAMAKKSCRPLEKLWELLILYFQVDAGSYTQDAGGLPSLDRLFCFNPEKNEMSFSPAISEKIEKLKQELFKNRPAISA